MTTMTKTTKCLYHAKRPAITRLAEGGRIVPLCKGCADYLVARVALDEDAARAFGKLVRNDWCCCKTPLDESYYERGETGLHGWACRRCYGITQTG